MNALEVVSNLVGARGGMNKKNGCKISVEEDSPAEILVDPASSINDSSPNLDNHVKSTSAHIEVEEKNQVREFKEPSRQGMTITSISTPKTKENLYTVNLPFNVVDIMESSEVILKNRRFFCSICSVDLDFCSYFNHEVQVHANFICLYCLRSHKFAKELMLHLKDYHQVPKSYFSNEIDFWGKNKYLQGDFQNSVDLICVECNKCFSAPSVSNSSISISFINSLKTHSHECRKRTGMCPKCNAIHILSLLGNHIVSCRGTFHQTQLRIKDNLCSFCFKTLSPSKIAMHLRSCHDRNKSFIKNQLQLTDTPSTSCTSTTSTTLSKLSFPEDSIENQLLSAGSTNNTMTDICDANSNEVSSNISNYDGNIQSFKKRKASISVNNYSSSSFVYDYPHSPPQRRKRPNHQLAKQPPSFTEVNKKLLHRTEKSSTKRKNQFLLPNTIATNSNLALGDQIRDKKLESHNNSNLFIKNNLNNIVPTNNFQQNQNHQLNNDVNNCLSLNNTNDNLDQQDYYDLSCSRPRRSIKKITNDDFMYESLGKRSYSKGHDQNNIYSSTKAIIMKKRGRKSRKSNLELLQLQKHPNLTKSKNVPLLNFNNGQLNFKNNSIYATSTSLNSTNDVFYEEEESKEFEEKETRIQKEVEDAVKLDPLLLEPDHDKRLDMLIEELSKKIELERPDFTNMNYYNIPNSYNSHIKLEIEQEILDKDEDEIEEIIISRMIELTSNSCLYCRQVKLIRIDKRQLVIHILKHHQWEIISIQSSLNNNTIKPIILTRLSSASSVHTQSNAAPLINERNEITEHSSWDKSPLRKSSFFSLNSTLINRNNIANGNENNCLNSQTVTHLKLEEPEEQMQLSSSSLSLSLDTTLSTTLGVNTISVKMDGSDGTSNITGKIESMQESEKNSFASVITSKENSSELYNGRNKEGLELEDNNFEPSSTISKHIPYNDFKLQLLRKVFRTDKYVFKFRRRQEDGEIKRSFEELPCECLLCGFKAVSQKHLFPHWRRIHRGIAMNCAMCQGRFLFAGALFSHVCLGTTLPNTEEYSKSTVPEPYDKEANQSSSGDFQTVALRYQCGFCDNEEVNELPTFFNYMVHLRRDHNKCELCLESVSNQIELEIHMKKHKLNHFCWKCNGDGLNITYCAKPNFMTHLFWKHGTESEICSKCLVKKWPHVYHFCIPPEYFICEECNLCFSTAKILKVHKRLHNGEKLRRCSNLKCSEKFISKILLEKHLFAGSHTTSTINTVASTSLNMEKTKIVHNAESDNYPSDRLMIEHNQNICEQTCYEAENNNGKNNGEKLKTMLNISRTDENDSCFVIHQTILCVSDTSAKLPLLKQEENISSNNKKEEEVKSYHIEKVLNLNMFSVENKESSKIKQPYLNINMCNEEKAEITDLTEKIEEKPSKKTYGTGEMMHEKFENSQVNRKVNENYSKSPNNSPIQNQDHNDNNRLTVDDTEKGITEKGITQNYQLDNYDNETEEKTKENNVSSEENINEKDLAEKFSQAPSFQLQLSSDDENEEESSDKVIEQEKTETFDNSINSNPIPSNILPAMTVLKVEKKLESSDLNEENLKKQANQDLNSSFLDSEFSGLENLLDEAYFDGVDSPLKIAKDDKDIDNFGSMSPLLPALDSDFNLPEIPTFEDNSLPEHILRENALFSLIHEHNYSSPNHSVKPQKGSPQRHPHQISPSGHHHHSKENGKKKRKKKKSKNDLSKKKNKKRSRCSSSSSSSCSSCGHRCSTCSSSVTSDTEKEDLNKNNKVLSFKKLHKMTKLKNQPKILKKRGPKKKNLPSKEPVVKRPVGRPKKDKTNEPKIPKRPYKKKSPSKINPSTGEIYSNQLPTFYEYEEDLETDDSGSEDIFHQKQLFEIYGNVPTEYDEVWTMGNEKFLLKELRNVNRIEDLRPNGEMLDSEQQKLPKQKFQQQKSGRKFKKPKALIVISRNSSGQLTSTSTSKKYLSKTKSL